MNNHLKNLQRAIDAYRRLAATAKSSCESWKGLADGSYDQALCASGYMTYMKHANELEALLALLTTDSKS